VIISSTSEKRLRGVHPHLVRVVRRCARDWKDPATGWIITCGVRTVAEQRIMVAKGASKTMRSRHIPAANGFSHAVDFAMTLNGKVRWDWPLYHVLAKAMKAAARAEKVPVEWGGDWVRFKDGPHFQLPWKQYPGTK
jgi:peptidoglycan LD-endopeptidase CwlK